ncbi:hypothetical protein UFOVP164_38 [uncultured Caudovirales phage]|uniref:Uncharacterized protein n=1 Tax=uncultured Caudovirales phage TaxID=2100421 RepID=A0A6J7XVP3_9CAUD|nr:hypothetical protein UFOVP164_38 [uncultured Caudovirales phage]
MKKSELKQINENLMSAYEKTQNAWGILRVLAHASQHSEPPPPWAVRDSCAAIEDYLIEITELLLQSGQTIEGDL